MSVVEVPADVTAPAYYTMPDYLDTAGPEATDFAASIGMHLDPAQAFCLDVMYAETKVDGDWVQAASEFGLVATRQQVKTYVMQAAALADAFLFGESVVWTAHRMRTTTKTMTFLLRTIESYDHLRRRVRKVSTQNGEEHIELLDGPTIEFMARTELGGRGFTGGKLILDEALAATPRMIGTLMPIMTSRQHWQIRYLSSAGIGSSTVLRGIRDRGRRDGGSPGLAWIEWGDKKAPDCYHDECTHEVGSKGCSLDDEDRYVAANVGLCSRRPNSVTMATLRKMRLGMPPEEFAREYLGWWDDDDTEAAIDPATWGTLTVDSSKIRGREYFALDVSPKRSWAAITVAGRNRDDRWHLEITSRMRRNALGDKEQVLDHRTGTSWVVPRFLELQKRFPDLVVHYLAGSATESLLPALKKAGIPVEPLQAGSFAAACGFVQDMAETGQLAHLGQPTLTKAVHATRMRDVGDKTRVWSRRGGKVDTTPMWAGTVALFAAYNGETADYDVLDSVF